MDPQASLERIDVFMIAALHVLERGLSLHFSHLNNL